LKPLRSPTFNSRHQHGSAHTFCPSSCGRRVPAPNRLDAAWLQPPPGSGRLGAPQCVGGRGMFTWRRCQSLAAGPWPGAIFCSIVVGENSNVQGRSGAFLAMPGSRLLIGP